MVMVNDTVTESIKNSKCRFVQKMHSKRLNDMDIVRQMKILVREYEVLD